MKLSLEEFARIAEETLDALPPGLVERLENVAIDIEEEPDEPTVQMMGRGSRRHLLGLFVGVPFIHQPFGAPQPSRIKLYKRNIERASRNRDELIRQIRHTLIHEIGHHVGYGEGDLRAMEFERDRRHGQED